MLKAQYKTNLNCGSCVSKVKPYLDSDPQINQWSVDTGTPAKILTVEGDSISRESLAQHLDQAGFKLLDEVQEDQPELKKEEEPASFLKTYRPLLLVLGYLLGIVGLVEGMSGGFDVMRAMQNFMGGFFVVFSFFKMLDLTGFVNSFQSYDILAKRSRTFGYLYPFIELGLGLAYLTGIFPIATNATTFVIMLIGILGVSQALLAKRKIQCACLGTVFNLPMSKVTFIEDGLMALMAAVMLFQLTAG
ncbi:MAG: hypothetical protein CMN21_01485 [Rubinisphaera sp.]|uniref:heavy-metal-associated domain-containing protein n=1 Tax=Rubinisphaera sp. TaxID=2024857 RepID=UPI000C0E8901|nr:heavy metal-associated domain-containing protein [Rubinisphaera sp.]MBV07871.1 hypothetical protein [Rubinisphaera sp.]